MPKRVKDADIAERLMAGLQPKRLELDVAERLATRWRKTFAARTHAATGEWTHAGFDWHGFSYGFVFAWKGEEARAQYRRQQKQQRLFVLTGPKMMTAITCEGPSLPWFDLKNIDVYVVSESFEWTMVFTHEGDWCGPYFTTAKSALLAPAKEDEAK
jgi:hypothetical protein